MKQLLLSDIIIYFLRKGWSVTPLQLFFRFDDRTLFSTCGKSRVKLLLVFQRAPKFPGAHVCEWLQQTFYESYGKKSEYPVEFFRPNSDTFWVRSVKDHLGSTINRIPFLKLTICIGKSLKRLCLHIWFFLLRLVHLKRER